MDQEMNSLPRLCSEWRSPSGCRPYWVSVGETLGTPTFSKNQSITENSDDTNVLKSQSTIQGGSGQVIGWLIWPEPISNTWCHTVICTSAVTVVSLFTSGIRCLQSACFDTITQHRRKCFLQEWEGGSVARVLACARHTLGVEEHESLGGRVIRSSRLS